MLDAAYSFIRDEKTGGLKVYSNFGLEITVGEAEQIVKGLTTQYLSLSDEEKCQKSIQDIYNEFEKLLGWYGPPISKKAFRKDLKKNWSFKCHTCEEKVSSKTDIHYWYGETCSFQEISYLRFCSESCGNEKIEEIRSNFVTRKKEELGLS